MKSKHLLLTLLLALFVPWAANAQTVTIGTGTSTDYYTPIGTYHNYSFSEQLYTASEINQTGYILNIGFSYAATIAKDFPVVVYMKAVDNADLSSGWISLAATDQVFNGTLSVTTSGWASITLDKPFNYDGTKNLLIAIDKAYLKWYSNGNWNHTSASNMTRYYVSDSSDPNPLDPPSGSSTNNRPNVQLTFGIPPTCFAPQNLTCTAYTATTATFTWQRHASGTETSWVLQYSMDNTFATGVQSVNVSDTPSTEITELTAEHKYYARVRPDCDENLWSDVCEFTPSASQIVTIGSGNTTTDCFPTHTNWKYSYTQQIYTADEIGIVGTIKSIRFKGNNSGTRSLVVYMANTSKESFSSATDVIPISEATQVFSGDVTLNANEWINIDLTGEGFDYEGENLAIIVDDNSGNYNMGSTNWLTFSTESNQGVYYYTDNFNIDPSAPSTSAYNGVLAVKNQIQVRILPSATPKPKNLHVVDGSLWSGGATLAWEAPATATPTSYEYCYKTDASAWSAWESTPELSVALNLSSSTHYTFRVRANYAEGNSDPVETDFTTLDDCAFPTNLLAYTTPGQGTKATLTWVKGYDEEAWVLEYATNNTFTEGLVEVTDGFTVEGNNVTANLTGLTAETHYYARVKANCGGGSTSEWSNVAEFTPTNYVDYTYNQDATSSTAYGYVPFYGSYVAYATHSRFIIPSTSLADIAGGTVKKLTFYSSTANADWGNATFKVYVAEVEASSFTSNPSTSTPFDWSEMTQVYSGSLSLANGMMEIVLDDSFVYSGTKNLMIGFEETNTGTNATASWYYKTVSNSCAYAYKSYGSATSFSTGRNGYSPKLTFNYLPTPYQKIAAINEGTIAAISAELTWTAPETTATITGYAYQYKLSSAAEWPTAWSNLAASATSVTLQPLTPGTSYDFQIKVLYGEHESVVNSTSFFTECAIVTAFPWKEDFEAYAAGDFNHPCWVNEHISGDGTNIFKVYTSANGSNTTHQLQLPDQSNGTLTKLRSPEMTLAIGTSYQFVIDVYRNTSGTSYTSEGVRVFASANGEIEGATELGFLYRNYQQTDGSVVTAENSTGWYTYEFPIPTTMTTCYIILRGENQYGSSTYMDNLIVEEIPTCARPSALAKSEVTNHSATLTWTAGDPDQHNWQVAYSKTSFDPNTANFDLTTVETVDFTTGATCTYRMDKLFDAESTYYLYIRANCGTATEPDYGPWSRKGINLTTLGASPAPSNFTASNIGSQTADLVWTAGGGDYELSWDLYYKQSDDAPTAPTEETPATKTVTTLPTTENPYTLDGLTEESRYYIWVRANHTINSVTTHSAWVALTGNYFTTLAACPTPTGLAYNNLTAVSADLTWVGSPDVTDYTVQYRTSAGMSTTVLSEHFDVSGVPTGWTKYTGLVDEVIDGTVTLSSTTSGWNTNTYALGTYNMKVNVYGSSCKYWLVTPEIELGTGNVLNFDLALTDYGNANVIEYPTQQPDDRFVVLVYADDAWHILREWNNSGSEYVYNTIATAGENVTIALSLYSGKTVKIAFYGESTVAGASSGVDDNDLHIDNVEVGTPTDAGEWITAVDDVETQSYQLTGLTGGVKYDVHVKSNCTSGEYCPEISFTTLADGTKVFVTAGEWGTATNWMPNGAPVITDEVILRANATIESGCVAEAKQITFQGSPTPTLTIENGGQLQHDNTSTITATVKKTIAGYGEENFETNNGYVLFAPPFDKYIYNNNSDGTGLRNGTYDLYDWSRTARPEWINYGANITSYLSMSRGTGYLYANQATTEVTFTGSIYGSGSKYSKYVSYTEPTANRFQDWNLIGNPFVCNAYLATETGTPLAYYKMNAAGNGFEAVTGAAAIAPMEGVFYQATETGYVYFFRALPAGNIMPGNLNINLTQAVTTRGEQGATDNAIIRFGEGNTLGKFSFREGSSKVYIPMEGKDYAVVNAEGKTGEIPVNFKAEKNGSYTLSFTSQEVSFSYLHLIDNLTGNDVDLLANPSYSFDAQTTDYANRFKLVFATGNSVDGDSFAFINGAGNLSIFGIEGTATVQVMDVLGHVLSSETFSGSYEKQLNVAPGVYMIRLINGNDVKVQKMIVK